MKRKTRTSSVQWRKISNQVGSKLMFQYDFHSNIFAKGFSGRVAREGGEGGKLLHPSDLWVFFPLVWHQNFLNLIIRINYGSLQNQVFQIYLSWNIFLLVQALVYIFFLCFLNRSFGLPPIRNPYSPDLSKARFYIHKTSLGCAKTG